MTTTHCAFELFSEILDHEPQQYSLSPDYTCAPINTDFLNMFQEYIATIPEVDGKKVEMVKAKLLDGGFSFAQHSPARLEQAQTIADKMLRLEEELFSK